MKNEKYKLYKVISKDALAQNGGNFNYTNYLPKLNKKGEWTPKEKVIKCESGYHVTNYWNMWVKSKDDLVFEVECKNILKEDEAGVVDKYVCSQIRLVKQIRFDFDFYYNTGNNNTGCYNTGSRNTGNNNTGCYNTGYRNTGDSNAGNYNSGDNNTGDRNTGNINTGNSNTGYRNTGHNNTGYYNTGDRNTGCWNKSNNETGFFNTHRKEYINVFNKKCKLSIWEKTEKPDFIYFNITNGYKEDFINSFNETCKEDVQLLLKLPDFDYNVFEEISGITKKMIEDKLEWNK